MAELESMTPDDASADEPHMAAALRQQPATIAEPAPAAQPGTAADVAGSTPDPAAYEGGHFGDIDFSHHRSAFAGAARLARMRELAARDAPPPGSARNSAREALDEAWRMIWAEHQTYDPMDPFGEALEAARNLMSQPWQPVQKRAGGGSKGPTGHAEFEPEQHQLTRRD